MGGIVAGCRIVKTRKGDRMAVFMLEDQTGSVEVVVYPEPYKQFASFVRIATLTRSSRMSDAASFGENVVSGWPAPCSRAASRPTATR